MRGENVISISMKLNVDKVPRTRCLKTNRSFCVRVSALATTGMRLTRVPRRFMISMSKGFNLCGRLSTKKKNEAEKVYARVTCGANKVQASMDTQIRLFMPLGLLFLTHVRFVLVVNELDNGKPRVAVVNVVSEPRGVDDSELDLELAFFELSLDDFHFRELVQLLEMTLVVVFRRRQLSREKGVDERRFAQPGFT